MRSIERRDTSRVPSNVLVINLDVKDVVWRRRRRRLLPLPACLPRPQVITPGVSTIGGQERREAPESARKLPRKWSG